MNELFEMIQPHIPTITVGVGLVINLIIGNIMDKKLNRKNQISNLNIDRLERTLVKVQEDLNDANNSKAVLKVAKQHEDRLSRIEKRLDEMKNEEKEI